MRLDRLQRGLGLALAGLGISTAWVYGDPPRNSLTDAFALRMTAGPSPRAVPGGTCMLPAESVIVRVTGHVDPRRAVLELNGFRYQVDIAAPDDVTSIRDDLIEQINAGEAGAVVATEDHSSFPDLNDAILLTAEFIGGIWGLSLYGQLESGSLVVAEDAILLHASTETTLVTLSAYSGGTEPSTGAQSLLGRALQELRKQDPIDILTRHGLAIWGRGTVNDLTALAGPEWESRAAVDLTIAVRGVFVEPVEVIEQVTVEFTVDEYEFEAVAAA